MWLSLAIDGGINIMNNALKGLQPEKVFMFFEELTQIPHGSHNTKQISDFCVDFAKKRGLKVYQDEYNNVVIYTCKCISYNDRSCHIKTSCKANKM